MLQDSTPTSLCTKAYLYSFSDEEKKRREGALKNKDFYYGRQEQYLELLNEDVDPITINLVNPIVSKRASLLYNRPLTREFDGPKISVDYLTGLYKTLKIDTILQKVDLSAELTGTSLVFVGLNSNSKVYLLVYDASSFTPVTIGEDNDSLEALSLVTIQNSIVQNGGNVDVKRVTHSEIWTKNYIYSYQDGIQLGSTPNLGYIPFVSFKAQEVLNQYLGHSPTISTRQLNQYLNQVITNLGYTIKMQAGTPVVLTGFQNGEGVSVHPGTSISLPVGASAGALQLNPKILEVLEIVKYIEDKAYQTSSIPKISVIGDLGQSSTSGVELMIKWAPLVNVFKEKTNRYQKYELDLANMILTTVGLEPINDIKVNYPEETLLPVDTDTSSLEQYFKYGLKTPIDEVIKINPNLSETEAEAMVRANLDFNKNLNLNVGGPGARSN